MFHGLCGRAKNLLAKVIDITLESMLNPKFLIKGNYLMLTWAKYSGKRGKAWICDFTCWK
jgi:hypothetical protein